MPNNKSESDRDTATQPGGLGDGSFEADLMHDDVPVLDLPLHSRIARRKSVEGLLRADQLDIIYGADTRSGTIAS